MGCLCQSATLCTRHKVMPVPIFVSYSRQDAGLVKPVVGLLRATKDVVFQDVDGIMPGKRWRPQIEEALGDAHLIVLFWCYHSSRSVEVKKEYELALLTGKDVLPVLLDATPLPKELDEYQMGGLSTVSGVGTSVLRAVANHRSGGISIDGGVFSCGCPDTFTQAG